jgi:hypothetical protein
MSVQRFGVSFTPELAVLVQAAAQAAGQPVSGWLAEAAPSAPEPGRAPRGRGGVGSGARRPHRGGTGCLPTAAWTRQDAPAAPERVKRVVETCSGCGQRVPDWPAGWLFLDDGHRYCPPCRKNIYLLQERWGLDIGDTSDDVGSDEVLRAIGVEVDEDPPGQ